MPFHGPHTDDTKERIAAKLRGTKRSDKTRQRISEAQRGRTFSPERRKAISEGMKASAAARKANEQHKQRMRKLWREGYYAARKPRTSVGNVSRATSEVRND